jgi:hypothetical protein
VAKIDIFVERVEQEKSRRTLCEIFSITISHLSCRLCNADACGYIDDDIYKPQEIECSLNSHMTDARQYLLPSGSPRIPARDPFTTNAVETSHALASKANASPYHIYFLVVIGESFAPAAGPGLCDLLGAALGTTERLCAMCAFTR